jgi:hypothetical protein
MNLLEFNSEYQKLLDEVRTEDLRTIDVFVTKSSGVMILGLMQDEEVVAYMKMVIKND